MQAETPQVEEDIQRALEDESSSSQSSSQSSLQSSNMQEEADSVEEKIIEAVIQQALADESATTLHISSGYSHGYFPPLTVNDAGRIIACLQPTPQVDTLKIEGYDIRDHPAVLNVFRDGLRLCTSTTTVHLECIRQLGNEDLDRLRPAFYNTSITSLNLDGNNIQGRHGGEVLRDLLVGNDTLHELILSCNRHFGPQGAIGIKQGLAVNNRLQVLSLYWCDIGNDFLANFLLPANGIINNSLTNLILAMNSIEGEDSGRQLTLLLQHFPALKVLDLHYNQSLGPLGAHALAPGLIAASQLEELGLSHCGLGNDGVANLLLPDGQVNRSLTNLDLSENDIPGTDGGRQVSLLLSRFPALKVLSLGDNNRLGNNGLGPLGARALAPGLAAASQLESLDLTWCRLRNNGVANLILPDGQVNRSLTNLNLRWNNIEGEDGGRQVSLLLSHFPTLKVLDLYDNNLGPLGVRALALGLGAARHLEMLDLSSCGLFNDGGANLILPDGQVNMSLTDLHLGNNGIEGEDGGRQVRLLMLRCPVLKVLKLSYNCLFGPLGAHALAPGLTAARHLETLGLWGCGLGNDGMVNLIPDGQVNRSLTKLDLESNDIEGLEGGENVIALVARCTNLNRLDVSDNVLSPEQRRHLDMLLGQNRLCTKASALGGSTFPVLFHFVEKAHHYEHGLSAIFVILQNDGDDYFCTALNRAIE